MSSRNPSLPDERTALLSSAGSSDAEAGQPQADRGVESPARDVEASAGKTDDGSSQASLTAVISLLLMGVFVANAEGSLVLASYGRIASDFNDLNHANWLVTSYTLTVSVVQPMYGKLSDIFGRAHVLVVAYGIFALGCAICALGETLPAVVVGRVVTGAGGAGIALLVSIIITDLVPLRDVGVWRSYVGIVATAGRASGGPIGGLLTDTVGWRWSFAGQCPPIILSMVLVFLFVPNEKTSESRDGILKQLRRVDFGGSLLLGSCIFLFLIPFEFAGTELPWSHPLVYGSFTAAAVFGATFFMFEKHVAKDPIMPIHILASRQLIASNSALLGQTCAQLGMMYTIPLYFQITQGLSATASGARLIPAVLGVTVAGLFGGFYTKRYGRYKKLLLFGTMTSSLCYMLLMLLWDEKISLLESLFIVPGGFGNGLVLSTAFIALTARTTKEDMATTCTTYYLTTNIGSSVGIATTSAMLQGMLLKYLKQNLQGVPDADNIIDSVTSNIDEAARLPESIKKRVVSSYVQSFSYAHGLNLAFATSAFFAGLFIKNYKI